MEWFVKSRRAQNEFDFETWIPEAVIPTLNDFDNKTDSRATVLIIASHMVDGARVQSGSTLNTLSAHMGTGGGNVPMIADTEKKTLRRITPLECERAQGFPDCWTASQSDSRRYKQLGNAVSIPVVDFLIYNFKAATMSQ